MSHLSTIIFRVNRRLNDVYKGDEKRAAHDNLWIQSVKNLMEYQEAWTDQTPDEVTTANQLYSKYSKYINIKS